MALRCPSELPAFGARLSRDVRVYVTNQCLKNYTVLGAKASWCQSKQWPEMQERRIKWLSASKAAEKVKEPMLGKIIRRLARRYR